MPLLESLFNHLALPPNLPRSADQDLHTIENDLVKRMIRAANGLLALDIKETSETWKMIQQALVIYRRLNTGRLDRESLQEVFASISEHEIVILHVVAQNAAIVIRNDTR